MRPSLTPLMIAATLIPAAASATFYSATFTAAPKGNVIARDVLWSCGNGACTGATDYSRPVIVCQSLAKKAGRIDAFRVDGQALAAAELARCNASAKPATNSATGTN